MTLPAFIGFFEEKKTFVLALLLCLLGISIVYRLVLNPFKQERVKTLTYTGAPKASRIMKQPGKIQVPELNHRVRLDLLNKMRPRSREMIRNVFYRAREPEVPGNHLEENVEVQGTPVVETPPPRDLERRKVEEDLSTFRTFGYLDRDNERILFLEHGNDILVIKEGDWIEGKYLVKEISKDRLTLWAKNIKENVFVDLTDF
ncbi:MAG: hypothetical protein JRH13_12740 [Deltaproteobacteria bacterium]|nr:hypothetical protein [Deltaproteobacteria bacterium]MBW2305213.1 hypothetical protein [Deltaproteobacteria bacterium]